MVDATPVDYDPFAAEQVGTDWLAGVLGNAAKSIWDIPREALESSEQLRTTGDYDPAPIVNAAGLAMTGGLGGVPAEAGEAILGSGPIRAYHGSPYDFDKFDMSKIGTGEGAQAYGHGLYFAENPEVAEQYAKMGVQFTDPQGNPLSTGHRYEVNINADPTHFLDWNKPLSEHSAHVQKALASLGEQKKKRQNRSMASSYTGVSQMLMSP